jgi:hypothetical protein
MTFFLFELTVRGRSAWAAVLGHGLLAENTIGNFWRVRANELRRRDFFRIPRVEEAEGRPLARPNA